MDSRMRPSPSSNSPVAPANNGVITQIKRTPEWIAGEAMGIDTSLLEATLRETPQQRIMQHERARRLATTLSPKMSTDGRSDEPTSAAGRL